jgi:hypothetical protein
MIKSDFISIPNSFKPVYNVNSSVKAENNIAVLNRNSTSGLNVEVYQNFDNEIRTYASKIPNEVVKSIVIDLLNKKLIFCGQLLVHQNGITGTVILNSNNNELIGVVVEMNNLEIDFSDGTTSRIHDVIYTIYQQYIRSVVLSNIDEIKKDIELVNLVEKYFNFLIIKILKLNYLNEKQRIIFDITTSVFFHTYYLKNNSNIALESAFDRFCPDKYREEISSLISRERMKQYTKFNELFNAYYDNKAIFEDPNSNLRRSLQLLKLYGYLFVSASLDYLISVACSSKYNFSILIPCSVDNKIQSHIEDIMINKYSNKIKFDTSAIKFFKAN